MLNHRAMPKQHNSVVKQAHPPSNRAAVVLWKEEATALTTPVAQGRRVAYTAPLRQPRM